MKILQEVDVFFCKEFRDLLVGVWITWEWKEEKEAEAEAEEKIKNKKKQFVRLCDFEIW